MADRPHLLVIMSDQHNPHVLGCAGNRIVRTPHLDALAREGVNFTQNHCSAPLCVPSRMGFMTGQHPNDIQVWTNGCVLAPDVPTFADALSLAGYETVLCGRMHFTGTDQHRGFEHRLVGDVSGAMRRTGHLFEDKIPQAACGQSVKGIGPDAVGPGRSTYLAYDEAVTRRAVELIRQRDRGSADRPLALVVGLLCPHNPFVCPRELFDRYMDQVTAPEIPEGCPASLHPAIIELWQARGMSDISPEMHRRARAAYYGLVTCLDGFVGQILAALRAASFGRDTAVAYTSDHGEMAGEHGMWWKENFYSGSAGVPLIWSWPRRFRRGLKVDAPVSLLDVAPTLLSLAGAEPLPNAAGRSLEPLLLPDGDASKWPGEVFAETFVSHPRQRPARMIRRGRWKLNLYHGHARPQLFDLEADPGERRDLGADPAHTAIRDELTARVRDGWDPDRIERIVAGRSLVRTSRRQARTGRSEVWTLPPGCNVFPEGRR